MHMSETEPTTLSSPVLPVSSPSQIDVLTQEVSNLKEIVLNLTAHFVDRVPPLDGTINTTRQNVDPRHQSTPYPVDLNSSTMTTSFDNNRPYGGLVKFSPPSPFTGKAGTTAIQVLAFISQMERYLTAVKIGFESTESLTVSLTSIREGASLWYDHLSRRDPLLIRNWIELKEQIIKRYQPIAQEQLSLSSLLKVRYRGSIQQYNDDFINHLQLLPSFNDPATESLIMGIYVNGITEAPSTTYISTVIRSAIAEKKAKTITELQSVALLAESNMGKDRKAPITYHGSSPSFVNRGNNFSRSTPSRPPYQNNRPRFHSPSSSIPAPSFSNNTPSKLNNIISDDPYDEHFENDTVELNNIDTDVNRYSEDNIQTSEATTGESDSPQFHEDLSSFNDVTAPACLNAIKLYEKSKKLNPSLSPEELDRRRRNQTCFRCNRTGHFINNCPLLQSNHHSKK